MDSEIEIANGEAYLSQHLYDVAFRIQQKNNIELRTIGINLNLKGTLDNEAFCELETLFS